MLIYIYLFTLILGGVLLGASILLGGKDTGDVGGNAGAGPGDGGVGADAPVDGQAGAHGSFDSFLWAFASFRFWTFFLTFFGITGVTFELLMDSAVVGLVAAIAMGLITGYGATAVIRLLAVDESTSHVSSAEYVGKTARVLVPVQKGGTGKVRVELRGTTIDLLAITDDDRPFQTRDDAMIIEVDGTRVRIARVDDKG